MNKTIKCILLDLDGTVINSGPDLIDSLNFALQEQKFSTVKDNIVGSLVGGGAKSMLEKALKYLEKEVSEDQLKFMIDNFLEFYFRNCSKKSKLYKNVISSLKKLKPKFKIGLCTNKRQHLTEKILEDFKIEKYFDFVLGSGPSLKLKPEIEMLDFSLKKLECKPENSIMVGDSYNDIIPAKKLGMKSIFVTYGYGEMDDSINADFVINTFSEIIKILKD